MKSYWTILAFFALTLTGCQSAVETPNEPAKPIPATPSPETPASKPDTPKAPSKPKIPAAPTSTASSLLPSLAVENAAAMAGYSREAFKHWTDADGDGCDARDEVLAEENRINPKPPCQNIETGRWYSPFDNQTVTVSADMDVDHLVPLAEAYRSGAGRWDDDTRERYANDMFGASLIAVTAASNRSKGDKDPSSWMPPNKNYHCTYLTHWVMVKYRWSLSMDQTEKAAVKRGLDNCPAGKQRVKNLKKAKIVKGSAKPPSEKPATEKGSSFTTCSEAKAAGEGPYRRGVDPEYVNFRDNDDDGIVCE